MNRNNQKKYIYVKNLIKTSDLSVKDFFHKYNDLALERLNKRIWIAYNNERNIKIIELSFINNLDDYAIHKIVNYYYTANVIRTFYNIVYLLEHDIQEKESLDEVIEKLINIVEKMANRIEDIQNYLIGIKK